MAAGAAILKQVTAARQMVGSEIRQIIPESGLFIDIGYNFQGTSEVEAAKSWVEPAVS
jgi:hypothetical protein